MPPPSGVPSSSISAPACRMQPSSGPESGPLALLDNTGGFAGRKRTALLCVGALLATSALILTIGLAATTRTENVAVGGYYPGLILGFGSFLGILGVHLVENRRQMLVAAIIFISFGLGAAFCCAVVDAVFAARHIDPRPITAGRCQFYSSGAGHLQDVYQTEVTCQSPNGRCQLKVKSNTCYCCDLYTCDRTELPLPYYEFVGVSGCGDALHLYRLLWASTVFNVLGLLMGTVTAAILGAFKDMVPWNQLAADPAWPLQTLHGPARQVLAHAGLCPTPALPTCSSFPLPLQPSGHCPVSLPSVLSLSEDTPPPSSSSCGLPPDAPPFYVPARFLPGEKPPPYAP